MRPLLNNESHDYQLDLTLAYKLRHDLMTTIQLPPGWTFTVNDASLVFKPLARFFPSVKILIKERMVHLEQGKRLAPKSSVVPYSGIDSVQKLVDMISGKTVVSA